MRILLDTHAFLWFVLGDSKLSKLARSFLVLPLQTEHAAVLTNLTFHHRDPFDRMIIAQAIAEQISILSGDKEFDAYPVPRIW